MVLYNKILFLHVRTLVLGFLFCFAATLNAMGQEERARVASDSPSEYSGVNDLEGSDLAGLENKHEEKIVNIAQPKIVDKREQLNKGGGEKVLKKDGMSTLSFNLFLYVVDRFKEDN